MTAAHMIAFNLALLAAWLSPGPAMLVAMVPSSVANQLHGKPEMLEPALEKNACQQRGVQSQTFQCTFIAADGPQSLIVAPEAGEKVPHKITLPTAMITKENVQEYLAK